MNHVVYLLIALNVLMACQKDTPEAQRSQCPNADRQYSRTSAVTEVSAVVKMGTVNNQPVGYWIHPSENTKITPWAACNLPTTFQKDSLKITVSGYLLTYPGFELLNVAALPFEITAIQVRE